MPPDSGVTELKNWQNKQRTRRQQSWAELVFFKTWSNLKWQQKFNKTKQRVQVLAPKMANRKLTDFFQISCSASNFGETLFCLFWEPPYFNALVSKFNFGLAKGLLPERQKNENITTDPGRRWKVKCHLWVAWGSILDTVLVSCWLGRR